MTYRTAVSTRRAPHARTWRDGVYRHHGITDIRAIRRWRGLGVPATVAAALARAEISDADTQWLAGTFSVLALRQLVKPTRQVSPRDIQGLRRIARRDVDCCRRWVKRTGFPIAEVVRLDQMRIPPLRAQAWNDRLSPFQRGVVLSDVLHAANVVHRVPLPHLAEWVRYTVDHDVDYRDAGDATWCFLGGHTALMAAAGLSPSEADDMTRRGPVDVAGLQMLAGLRAIGR